MRFDSERLRADLERAEGGESERAILRRVAARLDYERFGRTNRRLFWLWACGVFAAGLVGALGLYPGAARETGGAVVARIDGSESSIVGRWVRTGEETRQVRFSDGSELALFPNTEVKVEAASREQTRVRLGEGRTHVHVMHHKSTDYRFQAGPFEVQVTGTKFDLAWQQKRRHLELVLLEGGVQVTGPGLAVPRKVGPGEFLRLDAAPEESRVQSTARKGSAPDSRSASAESGHAHPVAAIGEGSDGLGAAKKGAAGVPPTGQSASWQTLLDEGQRRRAVQIAEARGALGVLSDGATASLHSLAHAARLEGSPRFARDLLLGLRDKRGERGQTAFYLGKIAYDQLGQKAEAKKWFETYLREAPSGTFAEQAWARLFELAGSSTEGRRLAREYLEVLPSGASSAQARSLLR